MPSYNRIIKDARVSENSARLLELRKEFARDAACEAAAKEAAEIVAAAREEAASILAGAREEAGGINEKAFREGYEKGYREGYEKAYLDAMEKAGAEVEKLRTSAWQVLSQIEAERRETLASIENEVVELSVTMAQKLVAKQLDINRTTVFSVIQEALKLLADRESFVIVTSPSEAELVRENKSLFLQVLTEGASLKVIGDPDIRPGGCRVESERGQIDAAIETRWQVLLRSLYENAGDNDE